MFNTVINKTVMRENIFPGLFYGEGTINNAFHKLGKRNFFFQETPDFLFKSP